MAKRETITPGTRFGRLVIIRESAQKADRRQMECLCDCGNTIDTLLERLKNGKTQSCGCLRLELVRAPRPYRTTHGHTRGKDTKTFKAWRSMRGRCSNPNLESAHNYYHRGIRVCDRWQKFENFLEDMGDAPEGMSIDRIDNDGNYEPGNCRWATPKQQGNNRSTNVWYSLNGLTLTISGWAESLGIQPNTLWMRIDAGMPIERALTNPLAKRRKDRLAPA